MGAASTAVAGSLRDSRFGLRYLVAGAGGVQEQRVPLAVGYVARFEYAHPVREFTSFPGQRSFSGAWWSATSGDLIGFESWLERDHAMALDQSPEVVAFASQPFWLTWNQGGKPRRHAPDYFARTMDGAGVVIDVRADDAIEEPSGPEIGSRSCRCCSTCCGREFWPRIWARHR
jgi:hypothetical protein